MPACGPQGSRPCPELSGPRADRGAEAEVPRTAASADDRRRSVQSGCCNRVNATHIRFWATRRSNGARRRRSRCRPRRRRRGRYGNVALRRQGSGKQQISALESARRSPRRPDRRARRGRQRPDRPDRVGSDRVHEAVQRELLRFPHHPLTGEYSRCRWCTRHCTWRSSEQSRWRRPAPRCRCPPH